MRYSATLLLTSLLLSALLVEAAAENEKSGLFKTMESREQFAREISSLIEKAWKKWQDKVVINNVYVEGSQGILLPGDVREPVFTASAMLEEFDRSGRSQDYVRCVRTVAGALENGMRLWQRGYSHDNIPFPQGASCVYTLPPSNNIPVLVGTGRSTGDNAMTEETLYRYMLYRIPHYRNDILLVFKGTAAAISECFSKWKASCRITDIVATGGVAPQPAPMGHGPGMVKGARGNNGRLEGAYFDGSLMYDKMRECFREEGGSAESDG